MNIKKEGKEQMLLRQIEYLQAVIECGSFYLAAEKCHVSQSAVSQQIRKLEEELGIQLLARHNRTFSLTPAGEHFYKKSLILLSDLEQMIRETRKIQGKDSAVLRLGYYKGYQGNEFSEAVSLFSEKYPSVEILTMNGSHEDIYRALLSCEIDLGLNDQRRAFSGAFHNLILSESKTHIEISSRNPLSRLDALETRDLKNTPCILVINRTAQEEEQLYYEEIVGLQGTCLFAETLQDARLKVVSGQGYLPVDVIGSQAWFDTSVRRIPLLRNGEAVTKTYCAFWRKDNSGYYVEEFAELLKSRFYTAH